MGDRTSVKITIGGKLPYDKLDDFVKVVEAEGLGADWDSKVIETVAELLNAQDDAGWIRLCAHECNYGEVHAVTTFCHQHRLAYRQEWDAGGDYGPGGKLYLGERNEAGNDVVASYLTTGIGENVCVDSSAIEDLGSWEALMEQIARLNGPLPKFEVIGAPTDTYEIEVVFNRSLTADADAWGTKDPSKIAQRLTGLLHQNFARGSFEVRTVTIDGKRMIPVTEETT